MSPLPENAVQTAEHLVEEAAAVEQTVIPAAATVTPTGSEAKVLGVEDFAGHVMAAIPGASLFAGFVPSAELATHVGYVAFHFFHELFQHAKSKGSAAPAAQ